LATKQDPRNGRLKGVHAPFRPILASVIRTGVLVGLALLLILGLFPAVLAAEAGSL
jgi:hypothetical protein